MSLGDTRTWLRCKDLNKLVEPVSVTRSNEQSPTIMEEGVVMEEAKVQERVPTLEVMWEVALVSKYQSLFCG
jgi:hypothetical protein